jgi:hypothetical protein
MPDGVFQEETQGKGRQGASRCMQVRDRALSDHRQGSKAQVHPIASENDAGGTEEAWTMKLNIPEFYDAAHSFTVDGRKLPSVTTIINASIGVNPNWTQESRDFGSAVHKAIHYYSEGDLDINSVDEAIKPRLEAYVKFCNDMQFKPDLIEQPLYHPTLFYAGIADQVMTDSKIVVDFKTGQILPAHSIQTSAYANLLLNPFMYERWTVQLCDNGKYKLETHNRQDLPNDFAIFQSMLNCYNWKKRFNL